MRHDEKASLDESRIRTTAYSCLRMVIPEKDDAGRVHTGGDAGYAKTKELEGPLGRRLKRVSESKAQAGMRSVKHVVGEHEKLTHISKCKKELKRWDALSETLLIGHRMTSVKGLRIIGLKILPGTIDSYQIREAKTRADEGREEWEEATMEEGAKGGGGDAERKTQEAENGVESERLRGDDAVSAGIWKPKSICGRRWSPKEDLIDGDALHVTESHSSSELSLVCKDG
ncbi:hypothetical protein B0H13DRAFT_1904641 [Mycena leptocephala]|nr:hypothetical protein B0H13DRAFT_1904641 [Mycena leptocephala]